MPVAYLDVPTGADISTKRKLVKALYDAMHEAYPFPDDTRIHLREWPLDNVSQNGSLGSEPMRPVFVAHVSKGGDPDAKRTMLSRINDAVAEAYRLPDFISFLHEHSLDVVAVNGGLLADDQQRVEDQAAAYDTQPGNPSQ
jgi:hypothetical protein